MNFGDNLKKIRKESKMSQEDLAEKVNVSRQSVSKWETGDAYPEMNNILELCKIFKCKINDLVHSNMDDFNSLDKDIIMRVVKFNEKEQKKMKTLSKILYVAARIGKIVSRIGIVVIICVFLFASLILGSTDFKDGKIVERGNIIKISERNNTVRFSLKSNDKVEVNSFDKDSIESMEKLYEKYSLPLLFIFIDGGLIFIGICLVLISKLLTHLEKLFMNIYDGETPFTMENVKHIKMMVHLMVCCIITSTIGTTLFSIPTNDSVNLDINLFSVVEILFVYAVAYIFEYGYKIQKDSKGVMYN
jgi:DNA-binding XRE family transcriptional regulator